MGHFRPSSASDPAIAPGGRLALAAKRSKTIWIRLGTIEVGKPIAVGTIKTLSYPPGPDYIHHPIGTRLNCDKGLTLTVTNGMNRHVVPASVCRDVQARHGAKAIRMGTPSLTVTLDLQEGSQFTHRLNEGWDFERPFTVHGITSTGAATLMDIVNAAESALVAVVGNRGSAGPMMSSGFFGTDGSSVTVPTILLDFKYEALSPDFVHGTIRYRGYPLPKLKFGGALGSIESNTDLFGNPITVSYTFPTTYGMTATPGSNVPTGDPSWAGFTDTVSKLIPKPINEPTVTIQFTIAPPCTLDGTTVNAAAVMSYFKAQQGDVNINLYDPTGVSGLYPSLGYLLAAPGCWLVEAADGDTFDGMITYQAELTFHLRPTGWQPTVTYTLRDTGDPPPNLVVGTGQKLVTMYTPVVFPMFTFGPN